MMIKHWLVIYDISNTKRLAKIAKLMEDFGIRVQKSVFEVEATDQIIKILCSKATNLMNLEEDFIVIFDICEKDWQKKVKVGPGKFEVPDEESYYIL